MARDIYMRTLYVEFERNRSIGLGSTFGDGHTDRQTDRQNKVGKLEKEQLKMLN